MTQRAERDAESVTVSVTRDGERDERADAGEDTTGIPAGTPPASLPDTTGIPAGTPPASLPDNSDLTQMHSDRMRDPPPALARGREEERSTGDAKRSGQKQPQRQKPRERKPTKAEREASLADDRDRKGTDAKRACELLGALLPEAREHLGVVVLERTRPEDLWQWADVLVELGQLPEVAVLDGLAKARHGEAVHSPWSYALTIARREAHGSHARAIDRVRFLRGIGFADAYIREQGLDPSLVPARPAAPASKTTEVDDDW